MLFNKRKRNPDYNLTLVLPWVSATTMPRGLLNKVSYGEACCPVLGPTYPLPFYTPFFIACVAGAKWGDLEGRGRKARKRGEGKGVSLPNNCSIPLPFSLPPYPLPLSSPESNLPLSTPATKATFLTKEVPFRKGLHWRMVSLSQT